MEGSTSIVVVPLASGVSDFRDISTLLLARKERLIVLLVRSSALGREVNLAIKQNKSQRGKQE